MCVCVAGGEIELACCGAGDYFGELTLMHDEPRKATIRAVDGLVHCYVIDRYVFNEMLGPLKDVLDQNAGTQLLKRVKLLSSLRVRVCKKKKK